MDLGLEGKVALVAGASRGIGFAVARSFLREGAKVVIAARNAPRLDRAAAELRAGGAPDRLLAVAGDMTDSADIARAIDGTIATFGRLDAVVANVGDGAARSGSDLDAEEWGAVLRANLVGSMLLARATLDLLAARDRSSLTFVSSIAGREAVDAPVTYAAAKAALESAMKSLSRLVANKGVRVNAVAPGNVRFPGGRWEQLRSQHPEAVDAYINAAVPMQRFGTPEEIADVIVFVSSERASFMTGTCVVVDGGQSRR